jgi:hypothetical protein
MAQIFASEGHANRTRASRKRAAARTATAPEHALSALQAQADASAATSRLASLHPVAQRMEEEEPLQGKMIQRMEEEELLQGRMIQRMEEEEPLQGKSKGKTLQRQTGGGAALPAQLQDGIQTLSGSDVSDVNVHYNSPSPAEVGAHAYAQGNDIHLASGQERHLPHEAWHVVQQREGRVKPTTTVAGAQINDDPGLEQEADIMGAKAAQLVAHDRAS